MNTLPTAKKTTLSDVASRAGVSKQTVSRVINGHEDVAAATRARVQQVVDELGYLPNALARGLSSNRSRTFGVISSRLEYYGPRSMFTSLEQSAHRIGYRMIPSILHSEDEVQTAVRELLAYQPDCIIWEVPVRSTSGTSVSDLARDIPIPMITMNEPIDGVQRVLDVDDLGGSRQAVEHLLDQGYRHVGILTGPDGWYSSERRRAGWQVALEERSAPSYVRQIALGDWTAHGGQVGVQVLLDQFPEMDALFACNDQMALGALHELHKRGVVVPDEFGVVGFDDMAESAYFTPGLTTVHQPYDQYGEALIAAMVQAIDGKGRGPGADLPDPVQIELELVVRESSTRSQP